MELKKYGKYALAIPTVVALLLALIPTLKYQWPLSWDIIYHVQYAKVYSQYGLTLTTPLLNAPVGQKIGYPPLFHFLLAGLGNLFQTDYFQVARSLQPVLTALVVFSTSYVAYKFYGKLAGVSAGFILISSYLFKRMILPVPENLALIFIPLAVYLYYLSIRDNRVKIAVLSGLILILIMGIHLAAALTLLLTVSAISLVELVYYRDVEVFKSYGAFLLPPILTLIIVVMGLLFLYPEVFGSVLAQGITAATGFATSLVTNRPLSIPGYLGNLGPLACVFGLLGLIRALKQPRKKDLFIIVWIVAMLLLSVSYLIGINVISYRVMIYILIPLSILAGLGLHQFYNHLKNYHRSSSPRFRCTVMVLIFILATLSGFLTVSSQDIASFSVKSDYGDIQIAPPSDAELDLASWFQENGNQNRSILISNQFTGMFLATQAGVPMHYGFEYYGLKSLPTATLDAMMNESIGYIVYDKKLVLSPPDESKLHIKRVYYEFFPLFYFSQDIEKNIDQIKPDYTQLVYENQEFIVCQVVYT
ncbi:hypothetical protein FGU46_06695 [Methanobacterium sp. CWC-01]|uniref:DUF6541 family protein n=1 Tax=Methanobacterium aridiramus TaxID=2584467 RepID=UPI0025777B9C|nr:DUF6541 family protein [Methanobacterium sp. CWC-01]WJI09802.1 hypothetical protein FGU46_06695 [Methanobacterium sp. CWC-01]